MWALTAAQRLLMLGSPDGKGSSKPAKRLSMEQMRKMTQKRLMASDDLTHDNELEIE